MEDSGNRGPDRIDDLADLQARRAELAQHERDPVTPTPPGYLDGPHEIPVHDLDHLPADVELGDATDPDQVSGDVTPQVEEEGDT